MGNQKMWVKLAPNESFFHFFTLFSQIFQKDNLINVFFLSTSYQFKVKEFLEENLDFFIVISKCFVIIFTQK